MCPVFTGAARPGPGRAGRAAVSERFAGLPALRRRPRAGRRRPAARPGEEAHDRRARLQRRPSFVASRRRRNSCTQVNTTQIVFRDPLEELLYASSVGLPSTHVYESVKDARAARARRLGALQRKLPGVQFALLYTLGGGILASFVLAVAGYAPGVSVVFEAHGFGALTFALVACLRVLRDIWDPTSGAYSVSAVLETMTEGLEDELDALLAGSPASESEAALAYGVI